MRVRHPEALDGVGGECPDRVGVAGETYECSDGATFDVSEGQAAALADRYGVEVSDIAVGEEPSQDAPDAEICGAEMSDGSTCERPADECPYH